MLSLSLFSLRNSIEAFSFYIVSFYIVSFYIVSFSIVSFYIVSINYPENHSFVFSQIRPTEETKFGQLRKRNSAN